MNSSATPAPTHTEPESLDALRERSARHFHGLLVRMAEQGAALAEIYAQRVQDQAFAGETRAEDWTDCTAAYNGLTRSVRRSVLLAQKLLEPAPVAKAAAPAPDRAEVRATVIRRVEDAIDREAPAEAEELCAELRERLDAPEFDDEIATRPVSEIVEEISRDLGAVAAFERACWKRRTPADVAALHALAAAPCRAAADSRPAVTKAAPGGTDAARADGADPWPDAPPIRGP